MLVGILLFSEFPDSNWNKKMTAKKKKEKKNLKTTHK